MEAQLVTQGTLQTREGRALPLERTDVSASVTGAIADVSVRQVFRNDGSEPIEAVYLFPLPHEASVYRMLFRIADRVVHGSVKEKAEARRVYERARSEGRAATLLEEDKPSLFTLSVANVAPGVTIEVELGYQEVLAYDDGRWRFVFPMVAPERYADARGSALPRRATRERAPDVSVEVLVRGDGEVEELRCPSHKTSIRHTDDGVPIVSLDAGTSLPNRDFVLTWRAGDTGVRPWLRFERAEGATGTFLLLLTPSVPKTHTEHMGGDGDVKAVRCGNCGGVIRDLSAIKEIPGLGPVVPCGYCGAILAPGTEVITRATRPRDVLILVDRSASMRGSMLTVRRAVRTLLEKLGPGDGAQLMAFDHDRVAFDGDGTRFAVISPELTAMAERFLSTLAPRGGTEMEEALERASKLPAREGRTRVVVLITDAAVGNEGRLLRRVPELLGSSTRLFVLGVGAAVDRRLVEKLARAGGGASDVALPNEPDDETLVRFARRVREGGAVLTNLTLYWEGAEMVDVYPKSLPDLHGGEPLRVFGRFTHVGMTKLVITAATADGKPYRQELSIGLPEKTLRSPGITRLWARRRVEDLAERANAGAPDADALRREGTALSLEHAIVGPFTSLVAEDAEVSVAKRTVRKARLRVIRGTDAGRALTLDRPKAVIGRGSETDLTLTASAVSRLHAEVTLEGDAWVIRDLASANGTRVDQLGVRSAALRPGAHISVGDNEIVFELAEGTFEVLPTKRVDVPQMAPARGDESPPTQGALRQALMEDDDLSLEGASPLSAEMFEDSASESMTRAGRRESRARRDTGAAGPPPAAAPAGPPPVSSPMLAPLGAAMPPGAPMPAPLGAAMPAPQALPGAFGPPRRFTDDGGPGAAAPGAPPPPSASYAAPAAGMFGAPPPSVERAAPKRGGGGFFSKIVDALKGDSESEELPPPPPPPSPPFPVPIGAPMPSPFGPPPVPPSRPMPPPVMPPVMPPPVMGAPTPGRACARCLQVNPREVRFCLSCGADLEPVPPAPQETGSDAYSAEELAWFRSRNRGELDLVFLVDETGSMGAYIAQVRRHLLDLVRELKASPLCRMLRLGIVSYRDHPPQDHTYPSKVIPLTEDIDAIRREVEKLSASGGGDGPESVTDGLYDLVRLDWRPTAARAVVWFGDAPPHGVEPYGDSFPDGCPCGHHWFTQAESCREMGVTVYAIGCLPGLRSFRGAEAVFKQVAETTHGVYLPLREASLLVPMIVGAASAELDRQRVDEHVADLVLEAAGAFADTTESERLRWLASALAEKGVRVRGVDFDESTTVAKPMRFRAITERDVAGSLDRLRYQGRIGA